MVTEFNISEVTVADYCRNCPVSVPTTMQPEGINFCVHGHPTGNCRHEECAHYAPCPHKKAAGIE